MPLLRTRIQERLELVSSPSWVDLDLVVSRYLANPEGFSDLARGLRCHAARVIERGGGEHPDVVATSLLFEGMYERLRRREGFARENPSGRDGVAAEA
jgi:hypothetical protein